MPVFIFDRADRVWTVLTGWLVFFVIMVTLTKPSDVATVDYYHVLDFYISSLAVTFVVLNVRYSSLKNMVNAQFLLIHDEVTGAKNRQALTVDTPQYVGKQLFVLYADLDQLTMINDLYGHEAGDLALKQCATAMQKVFSQEHVYRAGGDEFFCFAFDRGTDFAKSLGGLRDEMSFQTKKGDTVSVSCSFGYVAGTAVDKNTFTNMLHLAEVYAHKATARGRDQIDGGEYSEENLRNQIVDNETNVHARAYERNRLTGLPAMSYFIDRAPEVLREVGGPGKRLMIGYFNLADFKNFNDRFGYATGDELIRYTAELLKRFFSGSMICHVTGDQFGVVCYRSEVEGAMTAINGRLMTYREGFPVTAKAGFVRYYEGDSIIADFDKARMACRSIRGMKGKTIRYYDEQFDDEQRFRAYILSHVDEAAANGDLKVYYQPIIDAKTGTICAQEALVRWADEQYGFMSPGRFIPVLEENRLLHKVDLFVVRQVLKDFKTRQKAGFPLVPVSVNFSRFDFEQCDLVKEVSDLVETAGYDKFLIKVEITESAFVADRYFLKGEIERFKQAGFAVWMDDFGSGYSSLNLLPELPFNLVKIDMEFMKKFESSEKNRLIVEDIVHMVKRLQIRTLTEGIETRSQFEGLRALGCEFIQGFYFGRPQPLSAILGGMSPDDFVPIEDKDGFFEGYK